jgi:hypothetical protein
MTEPAEDPRGRDLDPVPALRSDIDELGVVGGWCG